MSAKPDWQVQWVNDLSRAHALITRAYHRQVDVDHPYTAALSCIGIELRTERERLGRQCAPWFDASSFDRPPEI